MKNTELLQQLYNAFLIFFFHLTATYTPQKKTTTTKKEEGEKVEVKKLIKKIKGEKNTNCNKFNKNFFQE